jgi:hypothetical protein
MTVLQYFSFASRIRYRGAEYRKIEALQPQVSVLPSSLIRFGGWLYQRVTDISAGQRLADQNVHPLSLSHSVDQIYPKLLKSLDDLLHAADIAQTTIKRIIQEHHFEDARVPWKKDGERMFLIDVILPEIVQQSFYSVYEYLKQKSYDPEYVDPVREQLAQRTGTSADEDLAQRINSSLGIMEKNFSKLYGSILGRLYPGDYSSHIYHRTHDKLPEQVRLMDALHQLKVWALVLNRRARNDRLAAGG